MPRRHYHKKNQPAHSDYKAGPNTPKDSTPYIIKHSDTMGRYLVASRHLPEGSVIINEEALVVGPVQDSSPVCLGCYCSIQDIRCCYSCAKCRWPLCSSKCSGLDKRLGHSAEECSVLESCSVDSSVLDQSQLYNVIVPLRCLLLRESHPDQWTVLMSMEAHNDIRRQLSNIWQYNQKTVVDRIRKEWKLEKYSEEDIHTVCGILEVNAFSIGEDSETIRGLYPTAFLIAHDCVSNTSHLDDERYRMTVLSAVPIAKDNLITLTYANSLQGTRSRREHLKQGKFFDCVCRRCRDPTELGTYLSGIKCRQCTSGHLLPLEPLRDDTTWLCDSKKCKTSVNSDTVLYLLNRIDTNIKSVDQNDIGDLEGCVERFSKVLHKNHFLILGLKYSLSQLYGKSTGFLIHQMTETMLERKREICEDLLQVFDVLEPGLSRLRGVTLYELHAPIMVLTMRRSEAHSITKNELCKNLRKVASCLRECSRILRFERERSQEGGMRSAAEDALKQLNSWEAVVGKL